MFKKAGWQVALLSIGCSLLLLSLHGTAFATPAAPELDPGSAAGGLTVLTGAALLLLERVRRR
ncbi:MAG: hypothetical protein JO166_10495 [Deltaproteobacteria bacterium]|nr:hypothetical protein [Deltaproteobacteria bacterium]